MKDANLNGMFGVNDYCMEYYYGNFSENDEEVFDEAQIAQCEAYAINYTPDEMLCPKYVSKLAANNIRPTSLDLTIVIKDKVNGEFTHRCYVYLKDSNFLFSFGCNADDEERYKIDPLNFFFVALFKQLEDERMLEKVIGILKSNI